MLAIKDATVGGNMHKLAPSKYAFVTCHSVVMFDVILYNRNTKQIRRLALQYCAYDPNVANCGKDMVILMKKIINTFKTEGGKHCITNSLKQIFNFYGYPISEEMLFGIGEGLDFTYINLKNSPMVSGRSKIMEFEAVIADRLGIDIRFKQHKKYDMAFHAAKQMIDNDQPVLVYADMPFLSYLGMDEDSHFGGHSIVLLGYSDEQGCFYVSDRDNSDYAIRTPNGSIQEDYHLVDYTQMQLARSSNFRPFPANNKYAEFDFTNFQGINKSILTSSIASVCEKMLYPPANLKGINGIQKFSKEIKKWIKFDDDKLKKAGVTNYFQINADGGTGGGTFRNMYGGFLIEAAEILNSNVIHQIGNQFILLSKQWDMVADDMWTLHETGQPELLIRMSENINNLYEQETDLLTKLQSP